MTEPTDRDRAAFFGAMNGVLLTQPIGPKVIIEIGKRLIPALAAAREEERKRCKKEASWAIHDCALPRHEGNLHIRNLINRAVLQAIEAQGSEAG